MFGKQNVNKVNKCEQAINLSRFLSDLVIRFCTFDYQFSDFDSESMQYFEPFSHTEISIMTYLSLRLRVFNHIHNIKKQSDNIVWLHNNDTVNKGRE